MKGKLISFEGCEGVGKSTQIEMLKQYLQTTGQDALFLREPGGTEISERIREIILSLDSVGMNAKCEALLYCAARAQLIGQVILPALEQGRLVICDRFVDSTFAYQGVARGLGQDYVEELNRLTCEELAPELTVFLDLDPARGFARKGGADTCDRIEAEKREFHEAVYRGYLAACAKHPERIVRVASQGAAYEIHGAILAVLRQRGIVK